MRNVRLRDEPAPADDAVVIRGGVLETRPDDHLRERAREAEANIGLLAQSVLVVERAHVAHVCRHDHRVARYTQVNLTTVGRIRRGGFPLEPTGDAPHYSIVFPDLDPGTIERFRECFSPSQPNPPRSLPG